MTLVNVRILTGESDGDLGSVGVEFLLSFGID